jgi:hypothetical protein
MPNYEKKLVLFRCVILILDVMDKIIVDCVDYTIKFMQWAYQYGS